MPQVGSSLFSSDVLTVYGACLLVAKVVNPYAKLTFHSVYAIMSVINERYSWKYKDYNNSANSRACRYDITAV